MLVEEYINKQKEYTEKYGKACLLMQNGKFYEIYEFDKEYEGKAYDAYSVQEYKAGYICREMRRILGLKIVFRNKSEPHSLSNPMFCGFPHICFHEYRDKILDHGYTIIRIDEKPQKSKKDKTERELIEIISPGTNIENYNTNNIIICLYLDYVSINSKRLDKSKVVAGVSSLNVHTGNTIISEMYSQDEDSYYIYRELYRFLFSHKPKEIIVHINKITKEDEKAIISLITQQLDLSKYKNVSIKCNSLDKEYFKEAYQESVLSKAYPEKNDVINLLNLDMKIYARISFVILIQYCYEHNPIIISKISVPCFSYIDENNYLILTHNASEQLHIISKKDKNSSSVKIYDSILSVLDNCITKQGSRYLEKKLLFPTTDIKELNTIYDITNTIIEKNIIKENILQHLVKLKYIDLELLQRRLILGIIKPIELSNLYKCYLSIYHLYCVCLDSINSDYLKIEEDKLTSFVNAVNNLTCTLDIDKLEEVKYNVRMGKIREAFNSHISFIREGIFPEIDEVYSQLQLYKTKFDSIVSYLNGLFKCKGSIVTVKEEKIKDEDEDEDDTCIAIIITLSRSKKMKNIKINKDICGDLNYVTRNKSKVMITSTIIQDCIDHILNYKTILNGKLLEKYKYILENFSQYSFYNDISLFVSKIDFIYNNATNAIKYKYKKPTIHNVNNTSYFNIKELRHPLIERLLEDKYDYVTNDIHLGGEGSKGMLLYGVNSTGKSSLVKSLVVLVMAQAGCYVPCELIYYPYKKIITRLSGHDNLLNGESSFTIEMNELNTILNEADDRTLVLGDELCRGTEATSGLVLTITTIEELIKRGSTFIFATHMQKLVTYEAIKNYSESKILLVKHLSTHYDMSLDKLIYNRKLQEGIGSELYGLEVCKSIGMSKDFLDKAYNLRNKVSGKLHFVNTKKSRYNSDLYMDSCYLCGKELQLQTHHIQEQKNADDNGFIGYIHKNDKRNLIVLCEVCHNTDVHKNGLKIIKKQLINSNVFQSSHIPSDALSSQDSKITYKTFMN